MAAANSQLQDLLHEELSTSTLAALQQFLSDQGGGASAAPASSGGGGGEEAGGAGREAGGEAELPGPRAEDAAEEAAEEEAMFREQWGLSQFWYEDATAHALAQEVIRLSHACSLSVACLACPTLFRHIRRRVPSSSLSPSGARFPCPPGLQLLEFDRRFDAFGSSFTFYDYSCPHRIPPSLLHSFHVVVADPPYLSQECLEKTAVAMRLLARESTDSPKLLLLTGAVLQPLAKELLGVQPCKFRPQHRSKLGNEFLLYTNYEPPPPLGGWDAEIEGTQLTDPVPSGQSLCPTSNQIDSKVE